MLTLSLVLFLTVSVLSESVRETETWMPLKGSVPADLQESSGDFDFPDDHDDTLYDYEYEEDEFSGSGDEDDEASPNRLPSPQPDFRDNQLPEQQGPLRPTVDQLDLIRNRNQIPGLGEEPEPGDDRLSNVLMSHADNHSVLNKTEVLAALVVGGIVGLTMAVLLVLLLVYRMKKKDEGSYEVGKKPIYIKAPTTEIYA